MIKHLMISRDERVFSTAILYDRMLMCVIIGLSCVGLIMVASSSVSIGIKLFNDPLYFLKREVLYFSVIFLLSYFILSIPVSYWQRYAYLLFFFTLVILFSVLISGHVVNGANRWLVFSFFHIQPSEFSKLTFFCYFSDYLDKKILSSVNFLDCYKLVVMFIILILLLLMQPDFGTVIILILTMLSVLFIFGIRLWKFLLLFSVIILCMIFLVVMQPYRLQRIVSFWDPWIDPFGSGYQLIQSLVAFGRGEFFGQGLGNSIQKLEYLPEAHTDFIFSILAEELGFFGVLIVLFMMLFIIFRGMLIAYEAFKISQVFSGFLVSAIIFCFAFQVLINVGSVTGMLPTKGSTLPFISYGGSSLLVIIISMFILLRVDFELRCMCAQAFVRRGFSR